MDFISHGLWGGVAFGRKNKRSFWAAFLFGIAPDLFSFGAFFISIFLGIQKLPPLKSPDPSLIPSYVSNLYNISHSLIIFLLIFFLVWAIRKKPLWESSAWGLHILFDIPTHAHGFFPTPFLWPIFDFKVSGIPWTDPIIFFPNIALLITLYLYFFVYRKRRAQKI